MSDLLKMYIYLTLSGLLDTQMLKVARVKNPKPVLANDNYCIEDKMWVDVEILSPVVLIKKKEKKKSQARFLFILLQEYWWQVQQEGGIQRLHSGF